MPSDNNNVNNKNNERNSSVYGYRDTHACVWSSTALEDVGFEDSLHRAGSSFKSTSFRDTYHNDWQEYEQSLEDRLHQETSATIQRKQLLFSQQLQERVDYSREEHETKAREQQTQVKQSWEAIRLADIRW